MKIVIRFSGLLVLCISLLTGCNKDSGKSNQIISSDTIFFKQLVNNWNKAHNLKDVDAFSNLFNNSVLFYQKQMDKNSCIEKKLSLFKKHPDFYQQIFGEIQIDKLNDTETKCSFVKRVTMNQQTKDYPSYLIFEKSGKDWKIKIEGDLVTDKNLTKQQNSLTIPKDAIKGDFNGDGQKEYVWLVPPKIDEEGIGCVGECICYLKFSDKSIPSIKIKDCIGGVPQNEGDLNDNGTDEIGLLPDWFTSCWRSYYVYTFNSNWIYAVDPIRTHCNQWDEGIKPIEKDFNKKGYVIVHYSEHTGDDIVTKSKSVPIRK